MTPQVWSTAVGALPRLVALMQHPDAAASVQKQAKRALLHVTDRACWPPDNEVKAASVDDLSSLVRLLHGDAGFVQSAVMFTLRTLALHAYNRRQIIEAGAIGRIVQLLKSSSQEVQLSAVKALSTLAREPDFYAAFLSAGGALDSLTRLLQSNSVEVQSAAISTLSGITSSVDGIAAAVTAGALPPLVRLLSSKSATVQDGAATVLSNLASNAAHHVSIAAAGAIAPLVAMLRSSSDAVQRSATAALGNISSARAVQAKVVSAGAVTPLAKMLKSQSAMVREHALRALGNISHHPDSIPQIFAAGAMDSVVSLLKNTLSAAQHESALVILVHLAALPACHAPLIAAGVVPHLIRALSPDSENWQEQCRAALALRNLASEDANRLRVVAAGAIDPLVKLLTSNSEPAQDSAAVVLVELIAGKATAADVPVELDLASSVAAVTPLIRLLCSESEGAHRHASRILMGINASSNSYSRAIAAAGGIPPLVRLLHSAAVETQPMVVSLLLFIVLEGSPANITAIKAAGALPILAKLQVGSKQGSEMERFTSDLLMLLSSGGSGGSTGPSGSGSANEGDGLSSIPTPTVPSSSPSSIPPAAATAAAAACPRQPATSTAGGKEALLGVWSDWRAAEEMLGVCCCSVLRCCLPEGRLEGTQGALRRDKGICCCVQRIVQPYRPVYMALYSRIMLG